ncbi:hypothetical protein GF314_08265 [bacterium]|nr:hypothetical protein [bacterium]
MRIPQFTIAVAIVAMIGPAATPDALTADPIVVTCPAEPPEIRSFALAESWRIDGDDDTAPLLGLVGDAVVDRTTGEILLLDRQLCRLLVFDAHGGLVGTLGREGEGPGEFRQPRALQLLADGRVAVRTGWPTELVMLARDGTPAGAWSPRTAMSIWKARPTAGGWIATGSRRDVERSDATRYCALLSLALFDAEGEVVREYRGGRTEQIQQPRTYDERQGYFAAANWDLTADGRIVVAAARDQYRLEYLDLDGEVVRVVERTFDAYRRTEQDLAQMRDQHRLYINGVRQEMVFHHLPTDPVIQRLEARPDGTLAVFTCHATRGLPDGVITRYDLHDATGHLTAEVRIHGDCDLEYDRLVLLSDDRAVVLRNYRTASRTAYNMQEEGDPERPDPTFSVIVCDLIPLDD